MKVEREWAVLQQRVLPAKERRKLRIKTFQVELTDQVELNYNSKRFKQTQRVWTESEQTTAVQMIRE